MESCITGHLLQSIPASTSVSRANTKADRQGTDYWINRKHGLKPISVDVKHRGFDPIERFGSDDACIETTSVYTGEDREPWQNEYRAKPGWTLNESKQTDLIIYTWPTASNARRFWILYFPILLRATQLNWKYWAYLYKERPAHNKNYLTLSIYPPRNVIAQAMRTLTTGTAT